jgi:hypothetical protein
MIYHHLTGPFRYATGPFMDLLHRASRNIAERLSWCTAHRDQAGIAKDLAEGKDISEVYGLGEAGLFDEFFYFLEHFGIMELFTTLDPKITTRESNVKFPAVILIYVMRIVAGCAFFWHIHPVILRFQPLMRLVGFNGRQIRDGTCARGMYKTTYRRLRSGDLSARTPLPPTSRPLPHTLWRGSLTAWLLS